MVIIIFLLIMTLLGKIFSYDCPVTSALDIVGDKWTLVVIKLMLLEQKKLLRNFQKAMSLLHQLFCLIA